MGKEMKTVEGLIHKASRKLFLTGTPVLNKHAEMHPLLAAVAPETFGDFWTFAKRYTGAHKGAYGWDFTGSIRGEELQEKLRATCMVRRLKADVLPELPSKRRQTVAFPANGNSRKIAAENAKMADVMADLEIAYELDDEEMIEAATRRAKVAFTEMSAARAALGLAKVEPAIEHIRDVLESTTKVILFAHHKAAIEALATEFGSMAVTLTGDTSSEDRQTAVDRFQTDDSVRVFIGSIGACREGITLTAASTVIFVELDWVPANMNQAEDRAHRIGQTCSVLVQFLVFADSLDERIAELLESKQAIANRALDNSTAVEVSADAVAAKTARETREASKPVHPPVPEEMRTAAHACMQILAGKCDGAVKRDDSGFSAFDVAIGHKMANMTRLSDGLVRVASRLATKYRGQLDSELVTMAGGKAK